MSCYPTLRGDFIGKILQVTSSTRPTGSNRYTGQYIYESDTGRTLKYNGTVWVIMDEPWQTRTTQIDQGPSVNIAKTLVYDRFRRSGTTVTWNFQYTITGAGTAANAVVLNGLPAASPVAATFGIGSGQIFDLSTGTRHIGIWLFFTISSAIFAADGVYNNAWGITPNAGLAAGDVVSGSVAYEYTP